MATRDGSCVPAQIFREYDIRGVVDQDLTDDVYYYIGRAYGTFLYNQEGIKPAKGERNARHQMNCAACGATEATPVASTNTNTGNRAVTIKYGSWRPRSARIHNSAFTTAIRVRCLSMGRRSG